MDMRSPIFHLPFFIEFGACKHLPHIRDCDDRLVSKGLHEIDLRVAEGLRVDSNQYQDANQDAFSQERNSKVRNHGALGNRFEYRLDVARRTGDQVQDFARRGLLLKRRRQLLRERRNPLLHASAQYCHLQPPVRGAPRPPLGPVWLGKL
jgi:hypothetical protein